MEKSSKKFGYEDLDVWSRAVEFSIKIVGTVDSIVADRKHNRLFEQIEASATSISMNLPEGKGRFSKRNLLWSQHDEVDEHRVTLYGFGFKHRIRSGAGPSAARGSTVTGRVHARKRQYY